ncbi:MAG: hypothetical protein WEC33_00810 [Dehalococcoidia bacterium]
MEAVVAGWVAGYAMGVVTTVALTYLVFQAAESGIVRRLTEGGMPPMMLSLPIFLLAAFGWTIVGLAGGIVYDAGAMGGQPDFAGSPSAGFTLGVLALCWLPLPPLVAFGRRYTWVWVSCALAFAGLFGWLLPVLAER